MYLLHDTKTISFVFPIHSTMSKVVVSNIPEKFSSQDLANLFKEANIPFINTEVRIMQSKRKCPGSTGRYSVLNFETDVLAKTAMEAINLIVVVADQVEVSIRATLFIPNFRKLLETENCNLCVFNIPVDLSTNDLFDLFSEFGEVQSAIVSKPKQPKSKAAPKSLIGFVLYKSPEEGLKAIANAHGKFLGPNQLFVKPFQSLEKRMQQNQEVLLKSIPHTWKDEDIKSYVRETMNKTREEQLELENIFDGILFQSQDTRPEAMNSGCQQVIFTCKSRQIAEEVIKALEQHKAVLEGAKEAVSCTFKLTKGMLAKQKGLQKEENALKYEKSGKNVQVFGLRTTVSEEEVRGFFSRYGQIEEVSFPNRTDLNKDVFHVNVLFDTVEGAKNAVEKAKDDVEQSIKAADVLFKAQLYISHKNVKSSDVRQKQKKVEETID